MATIFRGLATKMARCVKNSVVLCAFSVALCVINYITEFHEEGADIHKIYKSLLFVANIYNE
jgi:hypothetical protein